MRTQAGLTVLTTKLRAGETYPSNEHGIRVSVPAEFSARPAAGPILLERTAEIVTCGEELFFITSVIHCFPLRAVFTEPVVLDFATEAIGDQENSDAKYKVSWTSSSVVHGFLC